MPALEYTSPRTGKVYEWRPEDDSTPTDEDAQWFVGLIDKQETDTLQPKGEAALNAAARGAANLLPSAVQGVGALIPGEGGDSIRRQGQAMQQGLEDTFPVNPAYEDTKTVKAAGAVGQGAAFLGAALAAPPSAILGVAGLAGAAGGADLADELDLTGWRRGLTTGGYAGAEILSERLFGIGSPKFLKGAGNPIVEGLKAVAGEAVEEPIAGALQDVVQSAAVVGTDKPMANPLNPAKRFEEAAYGAIGALAFGGAAGYQASRLQGTRLMARVEGELIELDPNITEEQVAAMGLRPDQVMQVRPDPAMEKALAAAPTDGARKTIQEVMLATAATQPVFETSANDLADLDAAQPEAPTFEVPPTFKSKSAPSGLPDVIKGVHYSRGPLRLSNEVAEGNPDNVYGEGLYAAEPQDEGMWKNMDRLSLGDTRNDLNFTPQNPLIVSPDTIPDLIEASGVIGQDNPDIKFDKWLSDQVKEGSHDAIIVRGFAEDFSDSREMLDKRVRELWVPKFPPGQSSGSFSNGEELREATEKASRELFGVSHEVYTVLASQQNQIFVPPNRVSVVKTTDPAPVEQALGGVSDLATSGEGTATGSSAPSVSVSNSEGVPSTVNPESAPPAAQFTTERGGSVYTLHGDGTTSRVKGKSGGVHEGDTGPKQRSSRTVFVSPAVADALGVIYAEPIDGQRGSVEIEEDGVKLTWFQGRNADGSLIKRTQKYPYSTSPEAGLHPLEQWGKKSSHIGSKIVSVSPASPTSVADLATSTVTADRNVDPAAFRAQRIAELQQKDPDAEPSSHSFASGPPPPDGLTPAAVRTRVASFHRMSPQHVEVVNRPEMGALGWINKRTGTVVLNAPYLRSQQQIDETLYHEYVHRIEYDPDFQKDLKAAMGTFSRADLDRLDDAIAKAKYDINEIPTERQAVALARAAVAFRKQPGYRQIIQRIKTWFKQQFGRTLNQRDAEAIAARILAKSMAQARAERGVITQAGTGNVRRSALPADTEVTLTATTRKGPVELSMDAREAEAMLEKRRSSLQALLDCLDG